MSHAHMYYGHAPGPMTQFSAAAGANPARRHAVAKAQMRPHDNQDKSPTINKHDYLQSNPANPTCRKRYRTEQPRTVRVSPATVVGQAGEKKREGNEQELGKCSDLESRCKSDDQQIVGSSCGISPAPAHLSLPHLEHVKDFQLSEAAGRNYIPTPCRSSSLKATSALIMEPSDEDVNTICTFTGCHPDLAKRALRAKHNQLDSAVNAIFENEDFDKPSSQVGASWNEGHFSGDRDGTGSNLLPVHTNTAPTRRPSPTPSLNIQQPMNRTDENADLERAVRESRQAIGLPPTQETGFLIHNGTELKQFGPANRPEYKEDEWAIVPSSRSEEIDPVPDLAPKQRIHTQSEPRLLKYLPDGDYTPNLITICHSIPAAREALLMAHQLRIDYGHHEDWWRGHPIVPSRAVNTTVASSTEPGCDDYDEFISEVQRLMAFLDASDRSYASIGALTQTNLIKKQDFSKSSASTLAELFLEQWSAAAKAKEGNTDSHTLFNIFTTTVATASSANNLENQNLTLIDLPTSLSEAESITLSELLDGLVWNPNDEASLETYLEKPAEILVMHLHCASPSRERLGVVIPAYLHIDKYLRENVALMRGTRQKLLQAKGRLKKLISIEEKLKCWSHPHTSANLTAKSLLEHSHSHFSGENRRHADKADTTNAAPIAKRNTPAYYPDVTRQLENAVTSIDRKLEILAIEKEKSQQTIRDISKSSGLPGLDNESRGYYTLRGVATKPNITYVLRHKDQNPAFANVMDPASYTQPSIQVQELLPQDMDEDDMTPKDYQWWRMDYEVSNTPALQTLPQITFSKAPDYDVLRAVELEAGSALLVYASGAACMDGEGLSPLPEALNTFVLCDNEYFKQELEASANSGRCEGSGHMWQNSMMESPPPLRDYNAEVRPSDVRPSIERRDSMDSTRAHGDDEDMLSSTELADFSPEQHHGFGLGYDVGGNGDGGDSKGGDMLEKAATPPVAEIRLPPTESQSDVETVEKQL